MHISGEWEGPSHNKSAFINTDCIIPVFKMVKMKNLYTLIFGTWKVLSNPCGNVAQRKKLKKLQRGFTKGIINNLYTFSV